MNRLNVRFFSIGMLVASIIIFLYGFFFENNSAKSEPTAVKEGYTLVEKDRLDLFKEKIAGLEKENAELKKTIEESKNAPTNTAEQGQDQVFMFEIREGMSLEDIARGLVGIHIITDQNDFINFMVQNGYEKRVQPGQYEFKQGISNQEIANMITK
ncbi:hypothetical protein [Caldifermentibacillus hisashii]|uniref:hypothetical protein n=1 Tax=Caldifermentibacillus hisashii TaxID=996558 RepID=UPI003100BE9E